MQLFFLKIFYKKTMIRFTLLTSKCSKIIVIIRTLTFENFVSVFGRIVKCLKNKLRRSRIIIILYRI